MKGDTVDGVENGSTRPGLLVERVGGAVTLRFNRPRQRNAFDWPVRHLLIDALAAASADPDVRVVVITGDRVAFSSGGDLGEMSPGAEDTPEKLAAGLTITELISTMPKPVVAAVQGHAAGAAFGIVLACDLVFAADDALFSPSFALIGLSTDLSASYWLPRALGLPRAKDILLSGRPLDAAAAYDAGIVSAVWAVDEFEGRLAERVGQLAAGPTRAFAAIKRLTNDSFARTLREQTAEEIREQVELVSSADHAEGVAAFLQRRPPLFEGR